MNRHRLLLASLTVGLLVPLATPGSAASSTPAAGSATSSATLVSVAAAGHQVAVATLSAVAQTVSSAVPSINLIPLDVNGTKIGAVTVDPSNSPKTVGALTTSGVPAAVLAATSPSATLTATHPAAGPVSKLVADLGSVSILGMPVTLDGGVQVTSTTTSALSQAGKAVTITRIALPSIADLLAALGLDISALPVDTLNGLLTDLPMTISDAVATAVVTANDAITTAQDALDTAEAALAPAQAAVDTATAAVASAQSTFDAALAAIPLTIDQWNALDDLAQQVFTDAYAAETALTTAQTALTTAQAALAPLQAAVDAATNALTAAIADLVDLVAGVLDETPLVEIGPVTVGTKALVGTTKTADVTGTISGLKVLGQDVLTDALGIGSIDVAGLAGATANVVNSVIASATGTLTSVLSSATGATGLVIPTPSVKLLTKTTKTGVDGAFGTADATVSVLSISLGQATIPTPFVLPSAPSLPGVTVTPTGITTAPLSISVGNLTEAARFRPASVAPPASTTPDRQLPLTGGSTWLSLLAVVAVVGAITGRRLVRSGA